MQLCDQISEMGEEEENDYSCDVFHHTAAFVTVTIVLSSGLLVAHWLAIDCCGGELGWKK